MNAIVDRELLHEVIDTLPPHDFAVVYKLFQSYINDFHDRHLTVEELNAHNRALAEDEWF